MTSGSSSSSPVLLHVCSANLPTPLSYFVKVNPEYKTFDRSYLNSIYHMVLSDLMIRIESRYDISNFVFRWSEGKNMITEMDVFPIRNGMKLEFSFIKQ